MPSHPPQLGSLAIQAPSQAPRTVHVSPATCHDISAFKELMVQYRRLDDTITMRLNRTTAQYRDRERAGQPGRGGDAEAQACAHVWRELVANWARRQEIVRYCTAVVEEDAVAAASLAAAGDDAAAQRRARGARYAEEVKRNQIRNELAVEDIVRRRAADAFRARCRYFEPPTTDAEGRKWWEAR
ncbi:caffeine-induced death protein 2-domain-containing protein [Epithele typhae]|uniref:caffeine-induced death protein 2-domain-containing protein n=1 Tax=Epithele typhae TaxID=378194 RepID=UPI002007EEFE|nr:caffeine-induced death protein 2-domain-containing protein [Epithele typhae]KAH9918210.1 caffeine-induced death protein 2-domain-containing protein [Epithele typhae]